METLERILAEHPLFSGMEQRHLQILVGCARNIRFDSEDVIFRQGEKANEFYLIHTGKVALQLFADRRGPLTILTLEKVTFWVGHGFLPPTIGSLRRARSRPHVPFPWMGNAYVRKPKPTMTWVTNS